MKIRTPTDNKSVARIAVLAVSGIATGATGDTGPLMTWGWTWALATDAKLTTMITAE
jgi:hypothetical protein